MNSTTKTVLALVGAIAAAAVFVAGTQTGIVGRLLSSKKAFADPKTGISEEVGEKLYRLGHPYSRITGPYTSADAFQSWRYSKGSNVYRNVLPADEAAILAEPLPITFGAVVKVQDLEGWGIAMSQSTRAAADAAAIQSCRSKGGYWCADGWKTSTEILVGNACLGVSAYRPPGGQRGVKWDIASDRAASPAEARAAAQKACAWHPSRAQHCEPLMVICADGRS